MKYCTFLLSGLFLLAACGGPKGTATTPEEQRLEEQAAVLTKMIEKIDTAGCKSGSVVEQVTGLQTVIDSVLAGKRGYRMFYLLNSGCSVCIGQLLDFGRVMERSGLKIPIYVIPVSRNHVPTIEYYLEQPGMGLEAEIRGIKHSLLGGQISDWNRTVVVTYGNRPVEQFVFE